MTGHGRGEAVFKGFKASVEVSAVNRKQLEIHVNLPREFDGLEAAVRGRGQQKVSLGRVTVRVAVATAGGGEVNRVVINRELASESAAELKRIAVSLGIDSSLSVEALMRVPGVVRLESGLEDPESVLPAVRKATDKALTGFLAMRRVEGRELGGDLEKRIQLVSKAVGRVKKRAPQVLVRYRTQLIERARTAGLEFGGADEERLLKEIVLFADRSDLTEELTRLESHFQQFHRLAGSSQPVGRTLDFLAQEMNREVNTVGSKANDARISKEVVLMKTELEKVREQVQNGE